MEGIWIRSQKRRFLNLVKKFHIYSESDGKFNIVDNNDGSILGSYESESRTVEVLDDIQNKMLPQPMTGWPGWEIQPKLEVYQMPEK